MTLKTAARRIGTILATLALSSVLSPGATGASPSVVEVDFSGVITLWDDFDPPFDNPRPMWAAASPAPECAPTTSKPLCPQAPGKDVYWVLGPGSGVPNAGVPCIARTSTNATVPCTVTAYGVFHLAASPVPGPYCHGVAQGPGHFFITIGGTTTHLSGTGFPNVPGLPVVPGVPSVHVLPTPRWELSDDNATNIDRGIGSMVMTKATPNCGLDAPDFDPATQFDVTVAIAWATT